MKTKGIVSLTVRPMQVKGEAAEGFAYQNHLGTEA